MINAKRKKPKCLIVERDMAIFRFLWRWKAVSTLALAAKFFSNCEPRSAYCRLMLLQKCGYIQAVDLIGGLKVVWSLTDKGFKYIEPMILHLESYGYKSEHRYHDYLTTAFHLGEWLIKPPEFTQTYSEQELRRIVPDRWESWVPRSTTHRPDGYSMYYVGEEPVVIAFEVELSLKANDRYDRVVAFYDGQNDIKMVFWIVKSKTEVNALRRAFEKFHIRDWSKHHFILLRDFQENGWMAKFCEG